MDRHLDTVWLSFLHSLIWLKSILFILLRISSILIWQLRRPKISWATTGMSLPRTRWSRTRGSTRGIHGFSNVGYFKYKIFTIYSRYEIEWIGREGLAPETHDAYLKVKKYLKVKVIFGSDFLQTSSEITLHAMPNAQFRSSSTTSTRTLSSWSVRMKNIKAQIINTCIAKNNSHSFLHNLKHNQTALWGRRTTRHRGRLSLSCCSIFTRARTTVMSSMAGNCHHHLANHGHRHLVYHGHRHLANHRHSS